MIEHPTELPSIECVWHWNIPYQETLEWMLERRDQIANECQPETLLMVEHPSTITLGKRGGTLLSPPEGTSIHHISRGGLATWHGPGQVVLYPLIHLQKRGLGVRSLVCDVEKSIMETLSDWNIESHRSTSPGIWVNNQKIASIGLEIRKGVSMHGASLNVHNSLDGFSWIEPCGMAEMKCTTLYQELEPSRTSLPTLYSIGTQWAQKLINRINRSTQ